MKRTDKYVILAGFLLSCTVMLPFIFIYGGLTWLWGGVWMVLFVLFSAMVRWTYGNYEANKSTETNQEDRTALATRWIYGIVIFLPMLYQPSLSPWNCIYMVSCVILFVIFTFMIFRMECRRHSSRARRSISMIIFLYALSLFAVLYFR